MNEWMNKLRNEKMKEWMNKINEINEKRKKENK